MIVQWNSAAVLSTTIGSPDDFCLFLSLVVRSGLMISHDWPWFVDFLGGAVFYSNNWPPLPAKLTVDEPSSPVTKGLPVSFISPANEWYLWKPSPRLSKEVRVLVTLDPSNYPIGVKDVIPGGDLPVVWMNTKYRMIYVNMGHGKDGEKIYSDPIQNKLFANAILWLGMRK